MSYEILPSQRRGSGDLLSGMIGGFISQGLSDNQSSVLGLLIHSFAANVARYEKLDGGMMQPICWIMSAE